MEFIKNILGKPKSNNLWSLEKQPIIGKHETIKTTDRINRNDTENGFIVTCKNCEEFNAYIDKDDYIERVSHPHGKWKPISVAYKEEIKRINHI